MRQVVSLQIAREAKYWFRTDKSKLLMHKFKRFDIDKLEYEIKDNKERLHCFKELLANNHREYFELTYEEIFNEKLSEKEKIETLNTLLNFLGYDPFNNNDILPRMRQLLNPSISRVNSLLTYQMIPNIYEIEKKLGNPDNGYLFI